MCDKWIRTSISIVVEIQTTHAKIATTQYGNHFEDYVHQHREANKMALPLFLHDAGPLLNMTTVSYQNCFEVLSILTQYIYSST